jgi:two-component system chemotaxis response regulator CheY
MNKPSIVCVDDQQDILAALKKDLMPLEPFFSIILCESAREAGEVMEEIYEEGEHMALVICDHVMPGKTGIDFLIQTNEDQRFSGTKKILLTGLATHQDSIIAINRAGIDHYTEKPWDPDELLQTTQVLLTQYLIHSGMAYQPFLPILDPPTLYKELRNRG